MGATARILSASLLGVLAACAGPAEKLVVPTLVPSVEVAKITEVEVELVEGPAVPMATLLSQSVAGALSELGVKSSTAPENATRYVLKGRVEANWDDRRVPFVMLIYWTLEDSTGNEIGAYTQGVRGARWKWEYGDPRIIRAVGNGAAKPIAAMILEDEETPLPFLLMGAGILVNPVEGAPGDGNQALFQGIKKSLVEADVLLTEDPRQASVVLDGRVGVEAAPNGRQQIVVVWRVSTVDGFEIGRATQENTVTAGSLDGPWGAQAERIADAAVVGIARILSAGNRPAGPRPRPGRETPPPSPDLEQIPGRAPPPPK